jgi:serine/threonine protein phosphatase PrpC
MRLQDGESESRALANQGVELEYGDQVLICSDGLTDMVEDQEIYNALHTRPAELAVETLLDLALQRGGRDNITLVIIGMPESIEDYLVQPSQGQFPRILPAALLVVLLSLIGMGVLWWTGLWPW